jgi:hypothetical protein
MQEYEMPHKNIFSYKHPLNQISFLIILFNVII